MVAVEERAVRKRTYAQAAKGGESSFPCPDCRHSFSTLPALDGHIAREHDRPNLRSTSPPLPPSPPAPTLPGAMDEHETKLPGPECSGCAAPGQHPAVQRLCTGCAAAVQRPASSQLESTAGPAADAGPGRSAATQSAYAGAADITADRATSSRPNLLVEVASSVASAVIVALADTGASTSLVTKAVAERIRLVVKDSEVELTGLTGRSSTVGEAMVGLRVSGVYMKLRSSYLRGRRCYLPVMTSSHLVSSTETSQNHILHKATPPM